MFSAVCGRRLESISMSNHTAYTCNHMLCFVMRDTVLVQRNTLSQDHNAAPPSALARSGSFHNFLAALGLALPTLDVKISRR